MIVQMTPKIQWLPWITRHPDRDLTYNYAGWLFWQARWYSARSYGRYVPPPPAPPRKKDWRTQTCGSCVYRANSRCLRHPPQVISPGVTSGSSCWGSPAVGSGHQACGEFKGKSR